MSKKNKGGKTPSAKATRNLEALKKAKEAALAAEAKEQQTVETPQPTEEKKEEVPEKRPTPAPKKTSYESYLEYMKHPHMSMLSQKIEKNDKKVEIITTEWKNVDTNETVSTSFSASFVKKGDGIDLKKLREQAEKGLKEYYAEKAEKAEVEKPTPKPEPKPEPKKEEKKAPAKKKEKVIIPEEVKVEEIKPKEAKPTQVVKVAPASTEDRIDANHGIELMKSFEKRADELEKGTELRRAMRYHADYMMFVYGKQWLDQCELDGDPALLKVREKLYNNLAIVGADFGITVKALPDKKDGQMVIDFKETLETAPKEVKEALEEDSKKEKPSDVIPEANASATEEEKVKAIDTILRMKNGVGGNLHNAIQFTKNAFPELKDACPAQVVAFIYSKIVKSTHLTGMANAIMGNIFGNGSIIASHVWMKQMMNGLEYNETEIADIVKVVLANGLSKRGEYDVLSKSCNKYMKQMNDDLINRIIAAKTPKDEANLKISGKYTELGAVQMTISSTKFINRIKEAYGADLSNKLLKQTMQRIMGLYSDGLKPLNVYVEKSTYATKK